eukprot:10248517-Alexandrium_andersonii.AAC.1
MHPGGPSLPLLPNRRVAQAMLEDSTDRVIDDDWRYKGHSAPLEGAWARATKRAPLRRPSPP